MKNVDLSLILACYNEEGILKDSFSEIVAVLEVTKYSYEIIFVDDCSNDKTKEIIEELLKMHPGKLLRKIYHEKNTGRGFAVSHGIMQASGRIAGFIDVDLEVHAHYIPRMVLEIDRGNDIVSGWRTYKLGWDCLFRYIATASYKFLVRKLLKLPLKDTETGIKFFNRQRILPVLKQTEDRCWFWDTEIMARSFYAKMKVSEVPVLFLRRRDKQSKVRLYHDSLKQLISLYRFSKKIKKAHICG